MSNKYFMLSVTKCSTVWEMSATIWNYFNTALLYVNVKVSQFQSACSHEGLFENCCTFRWGKKKKSLLFVISQYQVFLSVKRFSDKNYKQLIWLIQLYCGVRFIETLPFKSSVMYWILHNKNLLARNESQSILIRRLRVFNYCQNLITNMRRTKFELFSLY